MTGFARWTTAIALLVLVALVCVPSTQARADSDWHVVELNGLAQVVRPGVAPVALTPGDTLEPGQKIVTGPNGRVVLRRGTSVITVSPDSEMGLPERDDGGFATRILHRLGTLLFKVETRAEQHFEVKTPYMAAVVKGTTFTTSVDAQGASVHVVEGLVEVGDGRSGQVSLVRPGETARARSDRGGLDVLGAPAGGEGDGAGERAGTAGAAGTDSDGPAAAGAARVNGMRVARGVGVTSIDVATATHGLVRATSLRPAHAGAGAGAGAGREGEAPGRRSAPGLDGGGPVGGGLALGRSDGAPGRSGTPGNAVAAGLGGGLPTALGAGGPPRGNPVKGLIGGRTNASATTPAANLGAKGRGKGKGGGKTNGRGKDTNQGKGAAHGKGKGQGTGAAQGTGNGQGQGVAQGKDTGQGRGSRQAKTNGQGQGAAQGKGVN